MKLTKGSEFAILVLMYLVEKRARATTKDISKKLGISLHHLHKIVKYLSNAGYLRNLTGRNGGIELVMEPDKITLLEIIRLIEGPIYFTNCLFNKYKCLLSSECRLKIKMEEVQVKILDIFKSTTIGEMVKSKNDHK